MDNVKIICCISMDGIFARLPLSLLSPLPPSNACTAQAHHIRRCCILYVTPFDISENKFYGNNSTSDNHKCWKCCDRAAANFFFLFFFWCHSFDERTKLTIVWKHCRWYILSIDSSFRSDGLRFKVSTFITIFYSFFFFFCISKIINKFHHHQHYSWWFFFSPLSHSFAYVSVRLPSKIVIFFDVFNLLSVCFTSLWYCTIYICIYHINRTECSVAQFSKRWLVSSMRKYT